MTLSQIRDELDHWHRQYLDGLIDAEVFLDIAGVVTDDLPPEIRDDVKRELVLLGVEAGGRLEVVT